MGRKKKEEYCDDCGETLENCECDEEEYEDDVTIDDLNKGLDTLSKGLDVYAKYKKITMPPPQPTQPKPLSDTESRWIGQDVIRKKKINEEKKIEEGKANSKKLIMDIVVKIVVPIVAALIAVKFFLFP